MTDNDRILKDFLEEHIPFRDLKKAGFFPKDMKKSDIHAQAERICKFFGYKTVYEYGSKEIRAHISYDKGKRPLYINEEGKLKEEPFVTVIKSIYER